MFIKRVVLSILFSVIALTLMAQVSYSTYDCSDELSYSELRDRYCPNLQIWDNHDRNFPCVVSIIKLAGVYTQTEDYKPYFDKRDDIYFKSISTMTSQNVISSTPFTVTVKLDIDGKNYILPIPTVDWNITHKKEYRYRDFSVKDFQLKRLVGIAQVDGRWFFFIKKNNQTMTCFYYKSLGTFIWSNFGEVVLMNEESTKYLIAWLNTIPVYNVSNKWKGLITHVVSKSEGKIKFVVDIPLN